MKIVEEISPEQRDKVRALQATIDQHKRTLESIDYTQPKETYFDTIHQFWSFINTYDDEKTFAYFECSEYYQKNKGFFTAIDYSRIMETAEALNIMGKASFEDRTFIDFFDYKVSKELSMIDWQSKKKLVMVGSGPLPVTILQIHDHTNIEKIIGLDSNQESIYISGAVIRHVKGHSHRIQLHHYNGLHYDYGDADIIHVANFITPKVKILNRIAETAKDGVQILVRTPVSFGKMIFESALDGLNPRLVITQEGEVHKYFLEKTLVMQKLDI